MGDKFKQADVQVTAESEWGLERGFNLVVNRIAQGKPEGEDGLPKHNVRVKWRISESNIPDPTPEFGVFDETLDKKPMGIENAPNIGDMDIEDARGIVGASAGNLEELEMYRTIEASRSRGARKGVLRYIDELEEEIDRSEKKREKEAAKAQGEGDEEEED